MPKSRVTFYNIKCRKCLKPGTLREHTFSSRCELGHATPAAATAAPVNGPVERLRVVAFAAFAAAIAATDAPGAAAEIAAEITERESGRVALEDAAVESAQNAVKAAVRARFGAIPDATMDKHLWHNLGVLELRGVRRTSGSQFDYQGRHVFLREVWALLYKLGENDAIMDPWLALTASRKLECARILCPDNCDFGQSSIKGTTRHSIIVFTTLVMTGLSAENQKKTAQMAYIASEEMNEIYPDFELESVITVLHRAVGLFWQ